VSTSAPACSIPLPESTVPEAELIARATAARAALGDRLVILGHHYQKHEVIRFADITGDSFLLARRGAEATQAGAPSGNSGGAISLRQRLVPFLAMVRRCMQAEEPIVWGV